MLLVSPLAGSWSDRSGPQRPTLTALGIVVLAMVGAAMLGADTEAWAVGLVLMLFGAAFGLFTSPNSSAVIGDVSREQLGAANGAIATVRNCGRAVGVAVVVALFQFHAGTDEGSAGPPEVFLAGFDGAFLSGAVLACVAFATVVAMHRRRSH
jgi:MFS family permease